VIKTIFPPGNGATPPATSLLIPPMFFANTKDADGEYLARVRMVELLDCPSARLCEPAGRFDGWVDKCDNIKRYSV